MSATEQKQPEEVTTAATQPLDGDTNLQRAGQGSALSAEAGAEEEVDLQMLMGVPVTLSVEVGKTKMPIRDLLQLGQGSIVDLDRETDAPLDLLVNGTLIAQGEVVTIGKKFGLRLIDVISQRDRLKKLK
jgi:flagellar motor switch protein FliN